MKGASLLLALLLGVLVGDMVGCASAEKSSLSQPVTDKFGLKQYVSADAVVDAEAAMGKGDFRFLAVCGYTIVVPGVDDYKVKYSTEYPYRIIEGTSDTIAGPSDRELQLQVRDYAEKYNRTLVKHISG